MTMILIGVLVLVCLMASSYALLGPRALKTTRSGLNRGGKSEASITSMMSSSRLLAKGGGGAGGAASRRRKRRGKGENEEGTRVEGPVSEKAESEPAAPAIVVQGGKESTSSSSEAENSRAAMDPALIYANKAAYQSKPSGPVKDDGTSSIEDMFGLGNDQLRELMETELPVPREDLMTKKTIEEKDQDKDKVFALPDLNEFISEGKKTKTAAQLQAEAEKAAMPRVDRSNQEEYLRVMQLNPFADADDTMFEEEYDIIPSIFGSGKLLGIPVPYLQTGHGILLIVCVLGGFVYVPGNPLTEFPTEIRTFLRQSLGVVYGVNLVLAGQAFFVARAKSLPAAFWAAKTLVLGGVAFYEVQQAKDPTIKATPESKAYLSDRKSAKQGQPTQFKR